MKEMELPITQKKKKMSQRKISERGKRIQGPDQQSHQKSTLPSSCLPKVKLKPKITLCAEILLLASVAFFTTLCSFVI
jgi:hypothetical protein